jgi:AcrR family transcriptional regulator
VGRPQLVDAMINLGTDSRPAKKARNDESPMPEKTKDRLYPVVLQLFSVNDFHQVKMRTISQKSGVSVSNIYKYFSSKEDLLFTVLEERIRAIYELVELHVQGLQSGKEIFRKILWVTMDYYNRSPELAITAFITVPTRTWMQQESYPGIKLKEVFANVVSKLRDSGEIDPRIDVRLFQDIYYMICHRYIYTWYYFGRAWTLVDAISQDFDVLWKLLEKPNGSSGVIGASPTVGLSEIDGTNRSD